MSTPPAPIRRAANGKDKGPCKAKTVESQLAALSQGLGLVLERLEAYRQETATQTAEIRERQTLTDQREERWLNELGNVTRAMAQASVRAVREELGPVVRIEVEKQLKEAENA
jgi:hypothetical protein